MNHRSNGPRIGAPLRPAPDNEQDVAPVPLWMRWLLATCWIIGLLLAGVSIWTMMQGG